MEKKLVNKNIEKESQNKKGYSITEFALACLASTFLVITIGWCINHSKNIDNIHSPDSLGWYNYQIKELPKPINTDNIKIEDFNKIIMHKKNKKEEQDFCWLGNNSCNQDTENNNSNSSAIIDQKTEEIIDNIIKELLNDF